MSNPFIDGMTGGAIGGAIAVAMGFYYRGHVPMPSRASEAQWRIVCRHTFYLPLAYEETFTRCLASVSALKWARVRVEDRAQGEILAMTGLSFSSFGEYVAFHLRPMDTPMTEVEVVCRPIIRWTLFDYGRNQRNLEKVTAFLYGDREPER